MTRTSVTEAELVDIGRAALEQYQELSRLYSKMDRRNDDKYLDEIQMLEECARQLSDEVDALCEYVRHSRMLE